jgi:hypothetical protein
MNKQAFNEFKDLVQRKLQFVIHELKKVIGNSTIELLQMNKGKREDRKKRKAPGDGWQWDINQLQMGLPLLQI